MLRKYRYWPSKFTGGRVSQEEDTGKRHDDSLKPRSRWGQAGGRRKQGARPS